MAKKNDKPTQSENKNTKTFLIVWIKSILYVD